MKEEMSRTQRVLQLDQQHLSSDDEDKRFEKLSKIAGKYKKEEVFTKFKSPMLGNQSESSGSEREHDGEDGTNNEIEEEESDESGSSDNN